MRKKGEKKMTTEEKKEKFLKTLKKENISTSEIVRFMTSYIFRGEDTCSLIHRLNVNFYDEEPVLKSEYDEFFKALYASWTKSFSELEKDNAKGAKLIEIMMEQRSKGETERDFFANSLNKVVAKSYFPIYDQTLGSFFDGRIRNGFYHIKPNVKFQNFNDTNCRLYLNLDVKNALKFGGLLSDDCMEKDIPLYFKFWTGKNERNDPFVIFTNYDHVQDIVDIIQKYEMSNPELFVGASNANPFLARVDENIFFGEEPARKGASFSRVRANAIDAFFKKYNGYGELLKKEDDELKTIITNENLEPFFNDFGISIKTPYLNNESTIGFKKEQLGLEK